MRKRQFDPSSTVIDSSCLIHLWKLDLIQKLSVQYNCIYIPRYVHEECGRNRRVKTRLREMIRSFHPFLQICDVGNPYDAQLLYDDQLNPNANLDRGESEVIVQARERQISSVLIDDRKGKKMAEQHTLQVNDILDVLSRLKRDGLIAEVKPYLLKLGRKYTPKTQRLQSFLQEHEEL